ncbi:MAG TPA: helix-turn-helix domain-containing protein [Solirubrobacterales bacterium]|nr:helix-turn-helix domain-containing protein [Solirubrobacterales bacterium]
MELANKEFALLRALASEPRRVFSKDELLRDVWGFRSKGRTRTLDSHASRLRRKLDPEGARYVFNCWGERRRGLGKPDRAALTIERCPRAGSSSIQNGTVVRVS